MNARLRLPGSSRNQSGLTVGEVMISVSMMLVLASASMPSLVAMHQSYELRTQTRTLYVALQKARMSALTEHNRWVARKLDSGRIAVCHDSNQDQSCSGEARSTTIDLASRGMTITEPVSNVAFASFLPNGGVQTPGWATLRNGRGHTRKVSVTAAGRIRVD